MSKRKTVLRRQAREIIYNVLNYMQNEKDEGIHDVKQVQQRTADATGTSIRTVRNIMKESKSMDMLPAFRTPGKKRTKPSPITGIDNFDKGVIKRCIHKFHLTDNEMPTLSKLHTKLQSTIGFKGSVSSLSKNIKELGFKWRRIESNRRVLIEKHDIRIKRITYLQDLKKFRDEGRPIVYTAESYVHSSHTKPTTTPFIKRQRIIVGIAGSEEGFIPNALLMLTSASKSADYHDDMNVTNYVKWVKTSLIPNLKPNSVILMDNAPYHNVLKDSGPTSNSKKSEMESWLKEKGIPFNENMLKPELYELISQNKTTDKIFVIDDLFSEHYHTVLRIPPYHPDLNPIEMLWSDIREYVVQKNIQYDVTQAMQLIEEKVNLMSKDEWPTLCARVKDIEDEYRASDHVVDTLTEQIDLHTEGSSESESDDDDSNVTDLDETNLV